MIKTRRTVSKFTYYFVRYALVLILLLLEIPLIIWLERSWSGWGFLRPASGTVLILLSYAITNQLFRWLGLSRAGLAREERLPSPVQVEEQDGIDEQIISRFPRSVSNVVAVGFLLMFLVIFGISEILVPHNQQDGREVLPWLYGTFAFGAFLFFMVRYLPVAKLDMERVRGYALNSWRPWRSVTWEEVSSCEIRTRYNVFGDVALVTPVFRGEDGKPMYMMDLTLADPRDRDRIVKFIRERLPKDVTDLGDY